MERLTDQELLDRLRASVEQQQNEALSFLDRHCYKPVERWILNNSGSRADARDTFQDGIIILFRKVREPSFQLTGSLQSYLTSICRKRWLKRLSSRKVIPVGEIFDQHQAGTIPEEEAWLEENERDNLLIRLIGQLKTECRSILLLTYYERMRTREIIKIMNISNEQVARNKRSKCMNSLRKMIQQHPHMKENLR
ncbi:MAG: hypothetical protein OHK0039_28730 [Bacteroidia bacterium]